MTTFTPIQYVTGDATKPNGDGPKVIVHCCNDEGAWGAGFVLALSKMWPAAEEAYRQWRGATVPWKLTGDDERGAYHIEATGGFELGQVQFVLVGPKLWVANLIGQHGIGPDEARRAPIRYDAIKLGLQHVCKFAKSHEASVHMPRMGCGLAGGRWDAVAQQVQSELTASGVVVTVYDLPKRVFT